MHILITRPEPDAAILRGQLEALCHAVTIDPLLRIEPLPIAAAALDGGAGLIATSRNGLRALAASPALPGALKLPLIAVGPGTARLGEDLGFTRVIAGKGSAADLVPVIVEASRALRGRLIHVRGEETAFDLEGALAGQGIALSALVAYRAIAADSFRAPTKKLLAEGAINTVILMSPRTAAIFARLMAAEGLATGLADGAQRPVLLCLSPAVAASLEPPVGGRIEVAGSPNTSALLAAVTRVATLWSGV